MFAQARPIATMALVATLLAGCSSTSVASPHPTPSLNGPVPTPVPTPVPSPSASPIPPGPYAVVVTNGPRQGASYDILLIDLQGQVVTRVTAKLPLLKANQTVTLPLVSASNDLVYYLDGDTDIRSLSPSGATALVKSIAAGSKSIVAFAVSPDDQRIAVALINQAADVSKDTGRGYIEDLADTGNHVDLFNNTALDSIRWPVGWHGNDLVDAVGTQCGGTYGSVNGSGCAQSYHVIDSATGARRATICEGPATQPADANHSSSPSGLPVNGGTACVQTVYYYNNSEPAEGDLLAVNWTGGSVKLATVNATGQLPAYNCFLAPGAGRMACNDITTNALTILAQGSSPHSLGRRYNVLGWTDATHVLVDIDAKSLAIVDASTGTPVAVALSDADKVQLAATVPGAL